MNEKQSCAGFSLTSSRLQFIEIEKESDDLRITNYGQTFFSPQLDFNLKDENVILDQLQSAFDEIKIRNPITNNKASFALPPELFLTIQLPYDFNLNQNEIREEFKWELSQLFPFISIDDLALKFYEINDTFLPGKNNALIVALDKKYLFMIKKFCEKNQLIPKLVDNSSIAANSFINFKMIKTKNADNINIFCSKKFATLFVNISSRPAYVKVFRRQTENFSKKIIAELSSEIIQKVNTEKSFQSFITGEELGSGIVDELAKVTGNDFNEFNPFDGLILAEELQNKLDSEQEKISFTSAIGIASRFN
jgi:Tfp pilus assembly PilM family ATPase